MPIRVTLDTNAVPVEDWLTPAKRGAFEFAVVSVTAEEFEGTSYTVHLVPLGQVPKHTPFGSGSYGQGPYGGTIDRDCLKRALLVISNGSFGDPDRVQGLSRGEARHRRDAEIICVHAREGRDIFVTRDERGFIRNGRRESLEAMFNTRVMTPDEFAHKFGP